MFSSLKLGAREKRMLVYLLFLLPFAVWRYWPRHWEPTIRLETEHYAIASTASPAQTAEVGRVVEILYAAYREKLGSLPNFSTNHPKLQLILYKDRDELRRINPGLGWAEAFYKRPYCRAYFSGEEVNPTHWMLHEAVHQLNEEVAHLNLEKWLEEGLAEYFSTSRIYKDRLLLGSVDINTYPVWWIDEIATEPDLQANLRNGSIIPLRNIITNLGGPLMRTHVNLYYLHWWTLTHFVFTRSTAVQVVQSGGSIREVERLLGSIEKIEPEWLAHVHELKRSVARPEMPERKQER